MLSSDSYRISILVESNGLARPGHGTSRRRGRSRGSLNRSWLARDAVRSRRSGFLGSLTKVNVISLLYTFTPAEFGPFSAQLYRRRSLQVNIHFSAFFEIYKMCIPLHRSDLKISANFVKCFLQIFEDFAKFMKIL